MRFDSEYFNLGYLDTLSYKDTFIHRLDPRTKLLVTLIFIIFVVSNSKYEITKLIPFLIYPVFLLTSGNIPLRAVLKKILIISPFLIFIGIFNPIFDKRTIYMIIGIPISQGWISLFSIILKFILTVSSAILLIAVTSFPGICEALEKMKVPKILVIQLLFLYRYLFVLLEESLKIVRAREARSFGKRGKDIKTFTKILSVLLIRSLERAERIYQAMLSRGFKGEIHLLRKHSIGFNDIVFAASFLTIFYILKVYNIVNIFGEELKSIFF